ncbi:MULTISPECIES: queuosine precursor transporter [unclassified Paracoccus (in: a-proteobacteria)]|uniref:queuosine precursor transporter n=1 Tax=unclassified Paracoccus (in: a-proteobacteria) TaxID=2688777 RepID=UPI0015FEE838|nr:MULTISPECIES: queuosine precursor transporter [unclassified Paracoccus (in: a-proteobacteria)]MBB1491194.1 queuosine precursor transporter [Paracoccus sp. MC1854]MBB1496992.1 queuosine precursor transporter [Paracoccus sp. MC1862]QQO44598.1 queuosine precursor transporter [Paracoccus sp. MC1862]
MRPILPAILAMAATVLASNILVQFRLGDWLTWGALTYPVAFLVTDITNRVHGLQAARRVVVAGFVIGVFCSLVAAAGGGTTLRIALASGTAFLLAQLLDVWLFDRLRHRDWWQAPFLSSVVGSVVDTVLFFTIAFAVFLPADANTGWSNEAVPLLGAGPMAPLWMSLGVADWAVKMALALLALVPFRVLVRKILSGPASGY